MKMCIYIYIYTYRIILTKVCFVLSYVGMYLDMVVYISYTLYSTSVACTCFLHSLFYSKNICLHMYVLYITSPAASIVH